MMNRIPQSTSYNQDPDDMSQMSAPETGGDQAGGSSQMKCPGCGMNLDVTVSPDQGMEDGAAPEMPMTGKRATPSMSALAGKL